MRRHIALCFALSILGVSIPVFSSAAACPSLTLGSTGSSVSAVQQILYNAYSNFPAPTGQFDAVTQSALKQWQKDHGIPQTGTVGPLTATAMKLCTVTPAKSSAVPPSGSSQVSSIQVRTLFRGLSGPDVVALQQFLISQNLLSSDSATGFFGSLTEAAVQRFQTQKGIVSSGAPGTTGYGAVGPRTRGAMVLFSSSATVAQPTTSSGGGTAQNSFTSSIPSQTTYYTPGTTYYVPGSGGGGGGGAQSANTSSSNSGATNPPVIPTPPATTNSGGSNTGGSAGGTTAPPPPASCVFNGQTIASGSSVTAYQSSSVPAGSQCVSQQRTCNNGTLSQTYQFASCTVSAPTIAVTTIRANPSAQKPYMGFNTYYANRIGRFQVNQSTLTQIADDMKSTGMVAAGYNLLGFDIGWWYSTTNTPRDATTHAIIPSPLITDLPGLISHIHADGLTVGSYTDPGIGDTAGCGGFPGSGGYIDQDIRKMIAWGFDFLKLDHCGGNPHATQAGITDPMLASAYEYGLWSTAILSAAHDTGKQLLFNIGDYNAVSNRTPDWASSIGNSWRTQTDIALPPDYPITWNYILRSFVGNDVPPSAGPGHWNDPDYLLIGGFGLTPTEEQSNFNMWVIQAAPLMLATYPADLAPSASDGPRLRAMLLNAEVIAVDQDSLGRQGEKVREDTPGQVVYSKMLSGLGRRAVLLLNEGTAAASITVNWGDIGLTSGSATVRDLVSRTDLGAYSNSFTAGGIPAHGSRLLLVQGTDASAGLGSWQSLSKKVLGAPAAVTNGSVTTAVALGLDRYYWVRGLSGSSISNWTRIKPSGCSGDVIFFGDPVLTNANGAINLFGTGYIDSPHGQGIDSIRAYQSYSYDNGNTWVCYGDLGKPSVGLYGRLAAIAPDSSTVDLLGRGGDNAIWYRRWTSSGGWGAWTSAGACTRSGIGASTRPNGVADVVVIGCDNKVWHGWYTSSPGSINWESIPSSATFSGTPASVWNDALGQYTVYATALAGHDIQTIHWNSTSGWSSWTSLGGCSKAGIAAFGVSPTTLIGTACSAFGTTSDNDTTGDTPIVTSN